MYVDMLSCLLVLFVQHLGVHSSRPWKTGPSGPTFSRTVEERPLGPTLSRTVEERPFRAASNAHSILGFSPREPFSFGPFFNSAVVFCRTHNPLDC